jgi:hypothetical protein
MSGSPHKILSLLGSIKASELELKRPLAPFSSNRIHNKPGRTPAMHSPLAAGCCLLGRLPLEKERRERTMLLIYHTPYLGVYVYHYAYSLQVRDYGVKLRGLGLFTLLADLATN